MIDRRHSRWFVSTLFFAIAFVVPPSARAADTLNICVEKKTSKLVARRSCRRGESRLSASSLLQRSSVSASADGQDGVDGSLRVYGNGSSGPLTVSADTDWSTTPPPSSISYFSDVTIAAGARLTVPSGYVFRCNWTCPLA